MGMGQPDQQIGDPLILIAQLWAIAKARLAEPKGPAGQRNADPVLRHCSPGHLAALRWPGYFFLSVGPENS